MVGQASFLQSSEWEESQKLIGRETHRVAGVLLIRHDLWRGLHYLYCPRPVFREGVNPALDHGALSPAVRINTNAMITPRQDGAFTPPFSERAGFKGGVNDFLMGARNIAREEGAIFLRIDVAEKLKVGSLKFKVSRPVQPQRTIVADLQKPENGLLAAMHDKTRYNIRLAERKGVVALQAAYNNENILRFLALLRETAVRDEFHLHEREHYVKLPSVRSENCATELFFAEFQGKLLAAAMINFYKPSGTATYLHGASSRESREMMAPHLLHWRIMQEAKRHGFKYYDFGGIDEKRWPGLTRFKQGFGGKDVEYPPTIDIIYRPWLYRAYILARSLSSKF